MNNYVAFAHITILSLFSVAVFGADVLVDRESGLCGPLYQSYLNSIRSCTQELSKCVDSGLSNTSLILSKNDPIEVSVNHYGYTTVNAIELDKIDKTWVYLNKFQGDRHERLLETWLVSSSDFQRVLDVPPGPEGYRREARHGLSRRGINKEPFEAMLSSSEKISDTIVNLYSLADRTLYIVNDYEGQWQYGGFSRVGPT